MVSIFDLKNYGISRQRGERQLYIIYRKINNSKFELNVAYRLSERENIRSVDILFYLLFLFDFIYLLSFGRETPYDTIILLVKINVVASILIVNYAEKMEKKQIVSKKMEHKQIFEVCTNNTNQIDNTKMDDVDSQKSVLKIKTIGWLRMSNDQYQCLASNNLFFVNDEIKSKTLVPCNEASYENYNCSKRNIFMIVFITNENIIIPIIPLKFKFYHNRNLNLNFGRYQHGEIGLLRLMQKRHNALLSRYDYKFDYGYIHARLKRGRFGIYIGEKRVIRPID